MKPKMLRIIASILTLAFVMGGSMIASADDPPVSGQATGNVTVSDGGRFEVWLCESSNFGTHEVTSSTGASGRDRTKICYVDTTSYRDGFTVTLQASDFELQNSTLTKTIPAENLSIYRTVAPVRSSANSCPLPDFAENVGLIYATREPSDLVIVHPADPRPVYTWPANNLAAPLQVGRGEPGAGTSVGCGTGFGDVQAVIHMDLEIPAGQYPGEYKSTLTVNVQFDTPE